MRQVGDDDSYASRTSIQKTSQENCHAQEHHHDEEKSDHDHEEEKQFVTRTTRRSTTDPAQRGTVVVLSQGDAFELFIVRARKCKEIENPLQALRRDLRRKLPAARAATGGKSDMDSSLVASSLSNLGDNVGLGTSDYSKFSD